MRAARRFRQGLPAVVNALAVLAMLLGLLAPLAPIAPPAAAAQRGGQLPPPLPAPSRAVAVGNFQTALGCPADYDPTCATTELDREADGSFAAFLPIPPGDWALRIAAEADQVRLLGENGDPDGPDLPLSVPDGSAGVYVSYDPHTGRVVAEPSPAEVEVVTDLGEEIPLRPTRNGGYRANFDAQPGTYGFQVLVDDQLVAQDQISLDQPRRVVVETDESGQVTLLDTVREAELVISRVDESGQPMPGACFAAVRGGALLAQACDADDGNDDGQTVIRFPDGIDPGRADLIETRTPPDQQAAPDQTIDLGLGDNAATAVVPGAGQPAEEPTEPGDEPAGETPAVEAPGRLVVRFENRRGEPVAGGCATLLEFAFEQCDDDQTGDVVFEGLGPGVYTVRESVPPGDRDPLPDQQVEVGPEGGVLTFQHGVEGEPQPEPETPAPGETPVIPPAIETPATTPGEQTGTLEVAAATADGQPVPGTCFAATPMLGGEAVERCDGDDGANDGLVSFGALPAGPYRIDETATPAGFDPVPGQVAEVAAGSSTRVSAVYRPQEAAGPGIGRLVIDVEDPDGQPLGGACFDLVGPEAFTGICDQGDDGRLNIPDIPSGEYAARQTQAEEGFLPAAEQRVVVPADGEARLLVTNEPVAAPATETPAETPTPTPETPVAPIATETPTAPPATTEPATEPVDDTTGTLLLAAFDDVGQPVADGCYAVFGDIVVEVCDNDANDADPAPGRIAIRNLAPGEFDLFETRVPPGVRPAAAGINVDVAGGDRIDVTFRPDEVPTASAAQPATETPTPAETPAPTTPESEGTVTPVPGAGALVMRSEDEAGNALPGACYQVTNPAGSFGPFCDNENDGEVVIANATPGDVTVEQVRAPQGVPAATADQQFRLAEGETREVVFRPGPESGALRIVGETADGAPAPGACYAIAGPASGPACDDDAEDGDPTPGVLLIEGLPPGDYAISVTRPGQGFAGGEAGAQATVVAGETETARVTFEEEPRTGSLVVTVTRGEGVEGGFCVDALNGTLPNGAVCDDDAGDADPAPDRVRIDGLPPATYGIVLTDLGSGVAVPGAQEAEVRAGETAELTFALEMEAPATGSIVARRTDAAGNLVAGGCFGLLDAAANDVGEACDDAGASVVRFDDLAPGDYVVEDRQPPAGGPWPARQPATVAAGEVAEVTFAPIGLGAIAIGVSSAGQPVPFCATLTGNGQTIDNLCDNGGPVANPLGGADLADADPAAGSILVDGLAEGGWNVAIGGLPGGFATPEPQPIAVERDRTSTATFDLPRPLGDLVVFVEDEDGNRLPGTCLTLTDETTGQTSEPFCDQGDDGRLAFPGLAAGDWTVRQVEVAAGFELAAERRATVTGGQESEVTLVLERTPATPTATATTAPEATPSPTAAPEGTAEAQQPATPEGGPGVADLSPTPIPTPTAEPAEPGAVAITAVGEDGAPLGLPGACYAVADNGQRVRACDNDDRDADPAEGIVLIEDLAPGGYTVSQTRAPAGYVVADPVRIRVEPGTVAEVDVVNLAVPPASGSLLVTTGGPDGAAQGGACYRVLDADGDVLAAICDNGPSDLDPAPGAVGFAGLPAGSVTVEQTTAPRGFEGAEAQSVEIVGDAETPLAFTNQPLAPETGSVALQAFDETGAAVPGQCFVLNSDTEQFGPFCDDAAEDADPQPGQVLVTDLPVGVYEAIPQATEAVPSDPDSAVAEQPFVDRRTFTLARGRNDRPLEVRINVRRQPVQDGDLLVSVRDERNRPLAGACFELRDGNRTIASACDGERADGDGRDGQVRFADVRAGRYALVQTRAARGYDPASDQNVSIRAGQIRQVGVQNFPTRGAATGSLTVRTVDPDGDPVGGACYAIQRGAGAATTLCDDANDGSVEFTDLQTGAYLVRQTRAPAGFTGGNDTAVRVLAGEEAEVTVTVSPRPGSLLIRKTDTSGAALGGSCFGLIPKDGGAGYELCDGDPSDANPADGLILLNGVAPGDYVLRETRAPGGFTPSNDIDVTIRAGQRTEATVRNAQIPPPPRRGDLAVVKTNAAGTVLGGACFALVANDRVVAGPRCDEDDGARDGVTTFRGVGIGDYLLRETRRPSADYAPVGDQRVTVRENELVRVQVVNTLRPGRVLVRKTDTAGQPLAGACFDLEGDSAGAVCSDAAGNALFDAVPAGTYRLVETETPAGFEPVAPITGVVVNPGATTVLDVVNQPAPPEPDTGSLQVLKFICPAGENGEFTAIFDSSNPGAGKLGQTAGCVRGDARFRLERPDGTVTPFEFSTGAGGRFLTTLRAGEFILTEISPDLPGEASESVLVSVNQLTTVVVLNFVAPPAPEPASLVVTKYTCTPGLRGVVFEDFLAGCVEPRALTNDVVFRIDGPVAVRRVTGDGGELGVTRFQNLPAGDYRLREDVAVGAPVTIYAFCGADPNAPDIRAVGPEIWLRLGAGAAAACTYFNVPDPVTPTTGSIVVTKFACPVSAPPPGYDFDANCSPQGPGVRFALSFFDGEKFAPRATGATGADSILSFVDAAPGTYQLTEIGAAWCRAESDSVDANGNVIVTAGRRANVWIYNCIGPKRPPNTGAGPGAAFVPAPGFAADFAPAPVTIDAGRSSVSLAGESAAASPEDESRLRPLGHRSGWSLHEIARHAA